MPKLLLLTADENEACTLKTILGDFAHLVHARNLWEMRSRMEEDCWDVFFCAWTFYWGFWDGALQEFRERYPDLPVVVISRTGGEQEWLEVLEAGAFDLIGLPCQTPTLMGVVEQAIVSHEAQKAQKFGGLRRAEPMRN
jgi:DNA-binding NtrC family response regulator